MSGSYSPPLAKTTCITIPASRVDSLAAVRLLFRVSLSANERAILFMQGLAKLQLWSDIPAPSARDAGEWGEFDFVPVHQSHPLLDEVAGDVGDDEETNIDLVLEIPFLPSQVSQRRFSFTYRILHVSGAIQWLGEFGKNGVLHIVESMESTGFVPSDGWTNQSDDSWVRNIDQGHSQVALGRLVDPEHAYTCWSAGKDGVGSSTQDRDLLLFVPRSHASGSAKVLPILAFLSKRPSSVSFDPLRGLLAASGQGQVHMQRFWYEDVPKRLSNIVSQFDNPPCRVIDCKTGIVIASPSSTTTFPIAAIALPTMFPHQRRHLLQVPTLALLQDDACFSTVESIFLHPGDSSGSFYHKDASISLFVPLQGSCFLYSPVHHLGSSQWSVSLQTPHSLAVTAASPELPTPPPSPPVGPTYVRKLPPPVLSIAPPKSEENPSRNFSNVGEKHREFGFVTSLLIYGLAIVRTALVLLFNPNVFHKVPASDTPKPTIASEESYSRSSRISKLLSPIEEETVVEDKSETCQSNFLDDDDDEPNDAVTPSTTSRLFFSIKTGPVVLVLRREGNESSGVGITVIENELKFEFNTREIHEPHKSITPSQDAYLVRLDVGNNGGRLGIHLK